MKVIRFKNKKVLYFDEIYDLIESVFLKVIPFYQMNAEIIKKISKSLKFETKLFYLSDILDTFGNKTQLIVDIGKATGGTIYLSGTGGGKEYNDEAILNKNNIRVEYSDLIHPTYTQLWGDFISHLSIIDLLFNCEKNSRDIIINVQS